MLITEQKIIFEGVLDSSQLKDEIDKLLIDDDVTHKAGIFNYVLTRDERNLNIRTFSKAQKIEAYEKQKGICPKCKEKFEIREMEADHIIPWSKDGKTISENCQMLCSKDNKLAGNK